MVALWVGDDAERDVALSRPEMISLIEANELGNRTRYVIGGTTA